MRAYNTPEGTCVVLGDFLAALDVPMKVDLGARKASGWAFSENNRVTLDYSAMTASYGKASEAIAPGTIRETPEGWCVHTGALSRWFGIEVKPVTSGAVLMLSSEAKLPVELAAERARRISQLQPAKCDLSTLPQVRLPYRMWRALALDFVVSAGLTYRANDGVRVDRQSSVYAAGEIARLSYDVPPGIAGASDYGAVEKTRTSTAFRPQRPQRCASTSSATTARETADGSNERPLILERRGH